MRNEAGVTLIELLAGLVIVGLLAGAAWTAFSIGVSHGATETSKTKLQQEANLVMAKLRNEHRQSDFYQLRYTGGYLEIRTCKDETGCTSFRRITANDYAYSGSVNGVLFPDLEENRCYFPERTHTAVEIKVADKTDAGRSVDIESELTRILSDNNEEENPDECATE